MAQRVDSVRQPIEYAQIRTGSTSAHPNVVPLAGWKRERHDRDDDAVRIELINITSIAAEPPVALAGWRAEPAEDPTKPPRKRSWGFRWLFL
jgi:hypothetical protein